MPTLPTICDLAGYVGWGVHVQTLDSLCRLSAEGAFGTPRPGPGADPVDRCPSPSPLAREKLVWLALYEAARLSVRYCTALVLK